MFCRTSFGKPVLAAGQGGAVRFNLSHAENILAVAIARAEIGVDVEIIRPEIDLATLVADHLAPAERRLLEELPDEERPREFFRLWTQKEAAAKAAGRCLRCSPLGGAGRPSAACDACRLRQQVTPARPEDWRVRTFDARVGDVDVAASVVSAKFDIHPKQ
jgi:phosphopantetheinyl transferase